MYMYTLPKPTGNASVRAVQCKIKWIAEQKAVLHSPDRHSLLFDLTDWSVTGQICTGASNVQR